MRTIGTIHLTQKTQNDTAIRLSSVGTIVPVVPIVLVHAPRRDVSGHRRGGWAAINALHHMFWRRIGMKAGVRPSLRRLLEPNTENRVCTGARPHVNGRTNPKTQTTVLPASTPPSPTSLSQSARASRRIAS